MQLGQAGQLRARDAGGEYQSDRVGAEAAGVEPECLGRGLVKPLLVVDQADQGAFSGYLRQQVERRQANDEPVRRRPRDEPEGGPQRVLLRQRQSFGAAEHRRAQLMQARERQLSLRLHARRARDLALQFLSGDVLKQRRLAHPGLAAHDQDPALSLANGVHESAEHAQLIPPPGKLRGTGNLTSIHMGGPPAGEGAIQGCILHSRTWGRPPQAWGHPDSSPEAVTGRRLASRPRVRGQGSRTGTGRPGQPQITPSGHSTGSFRDTQVRDFHTSS